ncbi:hypothetical protein GCM10010964_15680 [Caldovatus sediminis]|uniref:Uncharacterized protein n=1 Tax=Caldovatus sediminis TaxID=2041189 RepID=A0A8J3EBP1_9PROT|nr:hypothetical protein [Caldovatus sediminis]GGG28607.1 hypothetical protein GCM10010964_15680 [Caldovatus sediminis]
MSTSKTGTATQIGPQRWAGPEWTRHVAGKALADRAAPRPLGLAAAMVPELTQTGWWKRAVAETPFVA